LEAGHYEERKQDMALVHKMALGGQLGKVFEMVDANDRSRTRQTKGEYRLIQKFARTDPRAVRAVDFWNKPTDDLVGKQQGAIQGEDD
jgi:hypothetical protein